VRADRRHLAVAVEHDDVEVFAVLLADVDP
jgi:hypothetical protein